MVLSGDLAFLGRSGLTLRGLLRVPPNSLIWLTVDSPIDGLDGKAENCRKISFLS